MNIINIQLRRNTSHVVPLVATFTFLFLPFFIHQVLQIILSFRENLLVIQISFFIWFLVLSFLCDVYFDDWLSGDVSMFVMVAMVMASCYLNWR